MVRLLLGAVATAMLLLGSAAGAAVSADPPPGHSPGRPPATDRHKTAPVYRPGTVLIGYEAGASAAERAGAHAALGASAADATTISPRRADVERVHLPRGLAVDDAVRRLRGRSGVRYAEPDYQLRAADTSNDPEFTSGRLWGMEGDASTPANPNGSGAAEAWQAGQTGSPDVYVGVVDEGIDIGHPDLAANVWTNPFDPVDGVDNDGNGYVDDAHGWDFFNGDNTVFDGNDTQGWDDHGTHVSGTIAGEGGNGTGVAGVTWHTKVISAKFLGPQGGWTSDAVSAIDYLTDLKLRHGIDIVASNNSWGGGGFSQTLLDAIDRGGDAGILFVAAANNMSNDNDASPVYPASYTCDHGGTRGWDCIISVAAIDASASLASFSDWGATSVDLGAPGVDIVSTVPGGGYASYSGTSMATPHVTGTVALCASLDPGRSAADRRAAILAATTPTASLAGRTVTGGRLDAAAAATVCSPPTAPVTGAPSSVRAEPVDRSTARVAWVDGAQNESRFEVQRAPRTVGLCGAFAPSGVAGPNATSLVVGSLSPASEYCFRVRAANDFGGGSASAWSPTATVTTPPVPAPYVCTPAPYSWIDPAGGTPLALGDDSSESVTVPFAVPFYDTQTSTVSVSSNGYVRLGDGPATQFWEMPIPTPGDGTDGFAAPFFDDLNPAAGGTVVTRTIGSAPHRTFVVGWLGVPHYAMSDPLTFELTIAEGSGALGFQYQDVHGGDASVDGGASASIGVESPDGHDGTQYSYDAPAVSDSSAVTCAVPPAEAPSPTVGIGNASVLEGDSGTRNASFAVTLSEPSTDPVVVRYSTRDGSATAGSDYTAKSGSVTIAPGARTAPIRIAVKGDTRIEPGETFQVRLSSPTGAVLGRRNATGTILNDDAATGRRIGIGSASVVEGNAGTRTITFAVTLSSPSTHDASVRWTTFDDTARAGADYSTGSGVAVIRAGSSTAYVKVTVRADRVAEGGERFGVRLSAPIGARIQRASAYGAVVDDDT